MEMELADEKRQKMVHCWVFFGGPHDCRRTNNKEWRLETKVCDLTRDCSAYVSTFRIRMAAENKDGFEFDAAATRSPLAQQLLIKQKRTEPNANQPKISQRGIAK
ncbi:hypothetical protein WR25_04064 [Diploscapter pachys]|uniref:Uncharacterized protein n=1 Tax=Diploscapter pachys TaxID=2018661 RepID=A0A2A2J590_9BILA|nr:hypothetical protein WR25_04064 [Diploscapter pachys]